MPSGVYPRTQAHRGAYSARAKRADLPAGFGTYTRTDEHRAALRAAMLRNLSNPEFLASRDMANAVQRTPELEQELIRCRNARVTWTKTAKRLGISRRLAIEWGKALNMARSYPPRGSSPARVRKAKQPHAAPEPYRGLLSTMGTVSGRATVSIGRLVEALP